MRKLFIITILLVLTGAYTVKAQGFKAPTEGKAVIYFTRVTKYGKPTGFEFFHQDKYIGVFKGDQYMCYECEPGNHLFWASSENKEFLTVEVEAGKTYIVMVNVIMGVMKAHVGLSPVSPDDSERLAKAETLVNKKPPTITPEKTIVKKNKKLIKFIVKNLDKYEEIKDEKNFRHLSLEMAIPQ